MVSAAEIRDEASLRAWLEGRPREDAAQVLLRFALRVAPLGVDCLRLWPRSGGSSLAAILLVADAGVSRPNLKDAIIYWDDRAQYWERGAWEAADIDQESPTDDDVRAFAPMRRGALAAGAAVQAIRAVQVSEAIQMPPFGQTHILEDLGEAAVADLWQAWRADVTALMRGQTIRDRPLWGDASVPDWVPMVHRDWRTQGGGWAFWADWYEGYLTGQPLDIDLLEQVAVIEPKHWDKGETHVHGMIAAIYEEWQAKAAGPLAQAAVLDFTFDGLHRWMRATGFEDDLRHLRDPAAVQAFLDDLAEVKAGLSDFADYAAEARGRTNAPAVLLLAADKLLSEIAYTRDVRHIRARRLVTLGRQLEAFLSEEDKCAEIGSTLQRILEDSVATFRDLCRRHFAPSIVVLQALDGLDLDGLSPEVVIARLDAAIAQIATAENPGLVPLRPEDLGLLRQMVEDLRLVAASAGEARTEQFAQVQRKRLARGAGEVASTIGHYVEKASAKAETAGKRFDGAVKWYHRWEKLTEAIEWLERFLSGTPPT